MEATEACSCIVLSFIWVIGCMESVGKNITIVLIIQFEILMSKCDLGIIYLGVWASQVDPKRSDGLPTPV
jgi:hypothetical protein